MFKKDDAHELNLEIYCAQLDSNGNLISQPDGFGRAVVFVDELVYTDRVPSGFREFYKNTYVPISPPCSFSV